MTNHIYIQVFVKEECRVLYFLLSILYRLVHRPKSDISCGLSNIFQYLGHDRVDRVFFRLSIRGIRLKLSLCRSLELDLVFILEFLVKLANRCSRELFNCD